MSSLCTSVWISDFCCSLTPSDAFGLNIRHEIFHYDHLFWSLFYFYCSSSVSDKLLVSCSIPAPQAIQLLYDIGCSQIIQSYVPHINLKLSWIFKSKFDGSFWPIVVTLFLKWISKGTEWKLVSCTVVWGNWAINEGSQEEQAFLSLYTTSGSNKGPIRGFT